MKERFIMLICFLKKNEVIKLKVFTYLSYNESASLPEIENHCNINQRTANRMIDGINEDLFLATSNSVSIRYEDKLFSITNQDNVPLELILKELYSFYLINSIEFDVFKLIFVDGYTNLIDVVLESNTSQSYCYSIIRKLNRYLEKYRIKISINDLKLTIDGKEEDIHIFLITILYCLNVLQVDLEFQDSYLDHNQFSIVNEKILTDYEQQTMTNIKHVLSLRQSNSFKISLTNKDVLEIVNLILVKNNLIPTLSHLLHIKKESSIFFNLFIRASIPNIDTLETRVELGNLFLTVKDNQLITKVKSLVNQIEKELMTDYTNLTPEQHAEIIYLITIQTCFLDSITRDYYALVKYEFMGQLFAFLPDDYSELGKKIITLTAKHSKKQYTEPLKQKDFTSFISRFIGPIIFSFQQPTLNILIDTSSYFMDGRSLKRQLLTYFSEDLIHFVTDYEQADYLITDRQIANPRNIPMFTFYDTFSNDLWEKLLLQIVSLSHHRLLNKLNHIHQHDFDLCSDNKKRE